jgi:FlaA1/EpsC-like NDP-sugar epimerase
VNKIRYVFLLIIDAILINLSVFVALLLRFDGSIPTENLNAMAQLIPLFTLVSLGFFLALKLYNRVWEYASIGEMFAILRATTCSMGIIVLIIFLFSLPHLPRSVYILSWVLMNIFIGASRISWRVLRGLCPDRKHSDARRVLIVGAGDAGDMLVREIQNNPQLKLKAVGFIDDDRSKIHRILHNVPVMGTSRKIPILVKELEIDEIIIAMPSVSGEKIRPIVDLTKQTDARVRILPGMYQSTNGNMLTRIRDIRMEDLLTRDPVQTNLKLVASCIEGQVVMVTGAGGSIGSELCRQIFNLKPDKLLMVDSCENNLFDIEQELLASRSASMSAVDSSPTIYPLLLDVRDRVKLERFFQEYHPQVVFHAAAYKHVPMMELHPDEAISNNVLGTCNVAELSDRYRVDTYIQVSTDKAVNPTSVMGASKRLAELAVKDIARNSPTRFAIVRFGNVLGSRGSVVPTFIKQIEAGGPVTVTHPDMKRFFMTIPEAVQLIIYAGAIAKGGEIFVLDMGKMVKIADLARDLIRLYGYEPDKDIEIVYTGIRPGEKLYEELFTSKEEMAATIHKRIFISEKEMDNIYIDIHKTIDTLILKNAFLHRATTNDIIRILSDIIPEYQHNDVAVN